MAKRKAAKPSKVKELRFQSQTAEVSYADGIPMPEPFFDLMQAYKVSPWAYACVFAIASNLASLDYRYMRLNKDGKFEPNPKNPFAKLLDFVNPYMTDYELKQATFTSLELTGNAYWLLERLGKTDAQEVWPVPPHMVKAVSTSGKMIDHYIVDVGGKSIRYDYNDVVHFRYHNPASMVYGQGSTAPAKNVLTTDLFATAWNKYFFLNSARPDAILESETALDDQVRRRIIVAWNKMHQGVQAAHRMAILEQGLKYKDGGRTQKDMDFVEQRKQNREEILASYGVPPMIVGVLEHANYANSKEQYKAFWMNTLLPKIRQFESTVSKRSRQITFELSDVYRADLSKVEALRADELQRSQVADNYYKMGIPPEQIITALDLPFQKYDGWELPFGGNAPVPLQAAPAAPKMLYLPKAVPAAAAVPAGGPEEPKIDMRAVAWKQFDRQVSGFEDGMRQKLRSFFKGQRNRIVKRMTAQAGSIFRELSRDDAGAGKSIILTLAHTLLPKTKASPEDIAAIINMVFVDESEANLLRQASEPIMRNAFFDFAVRMTKRVNPAADFSLQDPNALSFLDGKVSKMVREVNAYTKESISEEVVASVQDAIFQGFTQGEAIADLVDRIDEVYDFAATGRAERIARTEVIGSSNAGSLAGMKQGGATQKEWLSSRDGQVRDTHEELDGDIVAVTEAFVVPSGDNAGAKLQFPGDPGGPAGEVINCRCTPLPVVD